MAGERLLDAAGNVTYCGFVLRLAVTFATRPGFVIVRGVRAARVVAGPAAGRP
ncbi:MAG TPA: hypothetical protein VHF26_13855 [Trebonia sp.]|nr:hypothetical protein [Trebonia sp.]